MSQINMINIEPSIHIPMTERINKVIDTIKFFESLPPNELLDLIKQQMEKHSVPLNLVNGSHATYLKGFPYMGSPGPITHACQTLWEIITELESKCKQTTI